jgi:hypothetical protein
MNSLEVVLKTQEGLKGKSEDWRDGGMEGLEG